MKWLTPLIVVATMAFTVSVFARPPAVMSDQAIYSQSTNTPAAAVLLEGTSPDIVPNVTGISAPAPYCNEQIRATATQSDAIVTKNTMIIGPIQATYEPDVGNMAPASGQTSPMDHIAAYTPATAFPLRE